MKFKLLVLIILFFSAVNVTCAQGDDWVWAKSNTGTGNANFQSVNTDGFGNIYAVGYFLGTSISLGSVTVNSTNGAGLIVKYDANGSVLWAKALEASPSSVVTDAMGNFYIAGTFLTTQISFDGITLFNSHTFDGYENMFVVKYNSNGQAIWAKGAETSVQNKAWGNALAVDASGNVYVTGYFWSSQIKFGNTTLNTYGGQDVFLVKYDSTGNTLWAKHAGGTGYDEAYSIASDTSGNIYIVGNYDGSVTFGTKHLSSAGTLDVFIAKYDPSGNVAWAKSSAGGDNADWANGVATDASGNVYMTGYYASGAIAFGSFIFHNQIAGEDIFIVKYDSTGKVIWAQSPQVPAKYESAKSIIADNLANIYVIGTFQDSITFGSTTLRNDTSVTYDSFIAKYDSSGKVLWAKSVGGKQNDYINSITVDNGGSIYTAGFFSSASIKFGSTTFIKNAYDDLFIAKISSLVNIDEVIENTNTFIVFPNPLTSSSTLQFNEQIKDAEIIIYDIVGKEMLRRKLTGNKMEIEKGNMASGVYFIRVTENERQYVKKIVVE